MKERIFIQKAKEHVKLEEFIRRQFADAKCGDVEIQHTPVVTRIIIHTTTPGLVIGSGGERIREAIDILKKDFKIENPQVDVQKIDNPDRDPVIIAQSMAASIENGVNFRRLGNFYLERIMDAGAIGCEIVFAGKFSGQRGRTERFVAGYLKKAGDPAEKDVIKGFAVANPKLGNTGITVKIMFKMPETLLIKDMRKEKKEDVKEEDETKRKKVHPEKAVEKEEEKTRDQEKEEGFEEKSDNYGHN